MEVHSYVMIDKIIYKVIYCHKDDLTEFYTLKVRGLETGLIGRKICKEEDMIFFYNLETAKLLYGT